MVRLGQPYGGTVLLFFVYMSTACLSCLVSNQATVVIMYSIVKHLDMPHLSMHQLAVVLIIGSVCMCVRERERKSVCII